MVTLRLTSKLQKLLDIKLTDHLQPTPKGYNASRCARRQTRMLYVSQDYERGVYYEQYLSRVTALLRGLFLDLARIHKRVFQENYEVDISIAKVQSFIDDILAGVHSTFCPFVHKHMDEKKITPELWARCECGNKDAERKCPQWEGKRKLSVAVGKS